MIAKHPSAVSKIVDIFGGFILKHQDIDTLESLKRIISWAQEKRVLANRDDFSQAVRNYLLAEEFYFVNGDRWNLSKDIRDISALDIPDALAIFRNFNIEVDHENCYWEKTLEVLAEKIESAINDYQEPGEFETNTPLKSGCYNNYNFSHTLVNSNFVGNLEMGDQGDEVRRLQIALQPYGSSVSDEGVFGVELQKALLNFQKAYGLEETWELDEATRTELNQKLNSENAVSFCIEPANDQFVEDGQVADFFKVVVETEADQPSLEWLKLQFEGSASLDSLNAIFILDENHDILYDGGVDSRESWLYLNLPLKKGKNVLYVAVEYDVNADNDGLEMSAEILNVEFVNSYFQVSEEGATHTLRY